MLEVVGGVLIAFAELTGAGGSDLADRDDRPFMFRVAFTAVRASFVIAPDVLTHA